MLPCWQTPRELIKIISINRVTGYLNGIHYVSLHMAKINFEPLCLSHVSLWHKKCNPYPWKPYSRHKNRDSMYHGSKVIAKNLFRLLPMSVILNFVITKMPSGCNHYTHLIRKLHGIETPKMQRKDCYQAKQGFEEILACATRLVSMPNFTSI